MTLVMILRPTSEPVLTVIMVSSTAFGFHISMIIGAMTERTLIGSLTLLFQRASQTGLEILTPSQTWSSVPVFPKGTENDEFPPILVNIGDLLNYWTDGLLKSTVHRVVMPKDAGADRYSIAYFCHPIHDTELVRIPSDLVRARSSENYKLSENKKVMTAEEHLKSRLEVTYGWTKRDNPAHE